MNPGDMIFKRIQGHDNNLIFCVCLYFDKLSSEPIQGKKLRPAWISRMIRRAIDRSNPHPIQGMGAGRFHIWFWIVVYFSGKSLQGIFNFGLQGGSMIDLSAGYAHFREDI
jgi:hypothetical protein